MATCAFPHERRGATIIEFVVACSLLASLLLLVVPSLVRIGAVQRTSRHDRIAMDEITNQLERLAQLPVSQITEQLATLAPSDFAAAGLPDPQLTGNLQESEGGYRLALEISWGSPGPSAASVTLTTWVFPTSIPDRLEGGSAL